MNKFPFYAGADVSVLPDAEKRIGYKGFTRNLGVGTPGYEAHVEICYSGTVSGTKFNVFNVCRGIYSSIMERTFCIYDSYGAFLYGFRFKSYGAFGIEINDELLNIYLIRVDFVVTVDREGNLVEIRKIPYSNNSRDYMENAVFAVRKTGGDAEYSVRNDLGPFNLMSSTYSRLCVKTTDGSERILYDVNSSQLTLKIIASIVVMSIMVYGILRIVKEFKLLRAKRLESAKKDRHC